jgi:hypothetical protein
MTRVVKEGIVPCSTLGRIDGSMRQHNELLSPCPKCQRCRGQSEGVVCIPSLLAETEMNYVSKKTTHLVIAFTVATTASDKAMAHIQYAVEFCRAAHKKLTPVMCYTVGSRNARTSAWAEVPFTAHIMPLNINMHTGIAPSDAIMHGG